MAHKTLVGGTAYEVKGGRCLVDGTGYGIQKGRTLVDGTGYDVSFAPSVILVCITGEGDLDRCNVRINGSTLTSNNGPAKEVKPGDVITFEVGSDDSTKTGKLYINDSLCASRKSGTVTYKWTVPGDCRSVEVQLDSISYAGEDGEDAVYGLIDVYTHNTLPIYVTISGSGSATYCYASINGTKRTNSATYIPTWSGKTITFGVYGYSSTYYGEVAIDGSAVVTSTGKSTVTYAWTVPNGVTAITIKLSYTSTSSQRRGRITVTTT